MPRLGPNRRRRSTDGWVLMGIATVVLLANAPYLLHIFVANPIGLLSDLTVRGVPGIVGGQPTIDPNIGYVSQALGHLSAEDWLHLRVPWWNPYEGAGSVLAGEMQSAALFPPTLLLAFSDGQLYERILFELVAGFGTYLLLRRLELRRLACASAAVAFALNGTFAWLDNAAANPVALLPLLLLGIELAYAASLAGRRGGWWLIALALALSIYAGFPETAYGDGLLAAGWFIWRAASARRAGLRAFVLKGLAGALSAALLAAPIVVAFGDLLREGYTAGYTAAHPGGAHLPVQGLPQLVLPYIYGSIFQFHDPRSVVDAIWGGTGGYVGMSLVLFGAIGLFSPGRRGLRIMLGIWLALSLSRMYGAPGLGRILGFLPGMSAVNFYRYATPAVEMTAAALLALGINALAERPSGGRRAAAYGAAGLAIVVVAAVGARGLSGKLLSAGSREEYFTLASAAGGAVVLVGVTCTLLRGRRLRMRIACGLVLLETLGLFILPELSAPRVVHTDFAGVRYLRAHLGLARIATLGPMPPNYGSYFGLASVNVNDLPIPKAWAGYVHTELDPSISPLLFTGARNPATRQGELPYQELFAHLDGYRAAGVAYVLIPSYLRLSADDPHTFTRVFASPGTAIYRLAGAAPYFTASGGACQINSESRETVSLSCTRPSILTRLETAMSGWTARVDGRATTIHEVDRVFQSVQLGAGPHRVSFSYSPRYIRWGIAGMLAGIVWTLFGAGRLRVSNGWARRRR